MKVTILASALTKQITIKTVYGIVKMMAVLEAPLVRMNQRQRKMLALVLVFRIVPMVNVMSTTAAVEPASVMRAKLVTIKTNVYRKKLVPILAHPLVPFAARYVVKIVGLAAKARCVKKVLA